MVPISHKSYVFIRQKKEGRDTFLGVLHARKNRIKNSDFNRIVLLSYAKEMFTELFIFLPNDRFGFIELIIFLFNDQLGLKLYEYIRVSIGNL